jgi:hypothetical protein
MSQLVKTKRQANFKDFKRFGAFKGLVEHKNVFNSFVCKLVTSEKKRPNLHTNSLNNTNNSNLLYEFYKTLFCRTRFSEHEERSECVIGTK